MSDGINPATTSFSSPPLQFPNVPHQLPTMPHFRSQHSTLPSQQDEAQVLLGNEYGFRPCLSQGSVSSFTSSSPLVPASSHVPSSEQISPPKLVPMFKKRHPSRQVSSALLRLRKQEMLTGTSEETRRVTLPPFRNKTLAITSPSSSHLTTMSFPAHNLFRAQPRHSRLWAPPAPKYRCDLKTTLKQSSEREVEENISEHQTSGSSTQVSLSHLSYTEHSQHSVLAPVCGRTLSSSPGSLPDDLLLCSRLHLQVQMLRDAPGQENLLFLISFPELKGRVLIISNTKELILNVMVRLTEALNTLTYTHNRVCCGLVCLFGSFIVLNHQNLKHRC